MKKILSILMLLTVIFVVSCSTTEAPVDPVNSENDETEVEVVEETDSTEENSENNSDDESKDQSSEIIDPNAFVTFEGKDFEGNDVSNDLFKNNELTLVNVWGTNCGPCLEEIPYLQEINDELADEGLQIVGFLTGGESYKDEAVEILGMLEADYTNVIVPDEVFRKLGIQYIPTSFLVDSEGNVVEKRIVGALTKEKYLEKINKHLK